MYKTETREWQLFIQENNRWSVDLFQKIKWLLKKKEIIKVIANKA